MPVDWNKIYSELGTEQVQTTFPKKKLDKQSGITAPPKAITAPLDFLSSLGPQQVVRLGGQIGNVVGEKTGLGKKTVPQVPDPTTKQVLGDIGTIGLTALPYGKAFKAAAKLGKVGGAATRVLGSQAVGAGFSASAAAGEGRDVTKKDIAGGIIGGTAAGAAGEGVNLALQKFLAKGGPTQKATSIWKNVKKNEPMKTDLPQSYIKSAKKLEGALKTSKTILKQKKELQSAERSSRIGQFEAIGKKTSGIKGVRAQMKALKGELPTMEIDPLKGKLSQKDITNIYYGIKHNKNLSLWEKPTGYNALNKIIYKGEIPPESQLAVLEKVYGESFVKTLTKNRSFLNKASEATGSVLGIPRAALTSMDLSGLLRQGFFFLSHPTKFAKAAKDSAKVIFSEQNYNKLMREITTGKYARYKQGLALTDINSKGLTEESKIGNKILEKLTGGKKSPFRASNRAYSGFLNKLRSDMFDFYFELAQKEGVIKLAADKSVAQGNKVIDNISKLVNVGTGRGSLGKLGNASSILSTTLFSPRLLASRLQVLNPWFYGSLDKFTRKQALKSVFRLTSGVTATLGLASLAGAEVETDPTSSDFAKIKIGNTRYDLLAGHQQIIRSAARVILNETKSSITGKKTEFGVGYKPQTRLGEIGRFFEMKESPVVAFATDLLEGEDVLGRPLEVKKELKNRLVPIVIQDTIDAIQEWDWAQGAAMSIPAYLGVGSQTYGATISKKGEHVELKRELATNYTNEMKRANEKALKIAKRNKKYRKGNDAEKQEIFNPIYQRLTKPIKNKYFNLYKRQEKTGKNTSAPANKDWLEDKMQEFIN